MKVDAGFSWTTSDTFDLGASIAQKSHSMLSLLSKWCSLSASQESPTAAMSINLLPAILALCIFQVPNSSSRLRRVPYTVVCLLLLALCWVTNPENPTALQKAKPSEPTSDKFLRVEVQSDESQIQYPLSDSRSEKTWQLQQRETVTTKAALAAFADGSLDHVLQAAEQAEMQSRDAMRSSLVVAVLPLVLGVLLRQAPVIAVRARWRRSRSGILAAVCFGLLPCLAGQAEAELTTCPTVKAVCPFKLPAAAKPLSAATVPAGTAAPASAAGAAPAAMAVPAAAAAPTAGTSLSVMAPSAPSATTSPATAATPTAAADVPPAAATAPAAASPAAKPAVTPTITQSATLESSIRRSPPSPALAVVDPTPRSSYTNTLLAAMGARKEALHIASTPDDVPQRVDPVPMTPRLSRAVEQQMYSKLLEMLLGTSSDEGRGQGVNGTRASPRPDAPGSQAPKDNSGSTSDDGLLYLNNARLRVGMDPRKGGSLTYLSSPVMPPEWAGVNLVNTWDSGRLIQQSYYGCEDGSCWSDKPWRWNPVQGGSWDNASPKLLFSSNVGGVISTSSIPRNWGSQGLIDDMTMLTEARLMGSLVKVRFTMRYTGCAAHPPRHQEVPAVFVNRRLNVLATYTGNAPWTNGPLSFIMPGQTGQYYKPTERWAAYVDAKSGFGLGLYTPIADQLVAYRIGPEGSTAPHDCSYFAPLVTDAIKPDSEFSYDSYIAVGRVDEMRKWFADIAATVQPNLSAQRWISTPRSYAEVTSADAAPTPRNLVQYKTPTEFSARGTVNKTAEIQPASLRSSSSSSLGNHKTANGHAGSTRFTRFTPVLLSPQTIVVHSNNFSSKVMRAAQQLLLPFRQLPFRLLPGLDILPVLLPPMPVRVSVG